MKQLIYIISSGFRGLIFALVFGSIIIQPVVESMRDSDLQGFSWIDIESENDSSEKENLENEDEKNQKVEFRFVSEYLTTSDIIKRTSIFGLHFLKMDITIDTHDPPPEAA